MIMAKITVIKILVLQFTYTVCIDIFIMQLKSMFPR